MKPEPPVGVVDPEPGEIDKVDPGNVDHGGEKIDVPEEPEPAVDEGVGVISGEGGPNPSGGQQEAPLVGAAVISGSMGADAGGTRAAAAAGTMLGILAAVMSLTWALFKFKPGLLPLPKLGGGAGGGGASNTMVISGPQNAQTPLLLAENQAPSNAAANGGASAVTVSRAGAGAGSGAGSGGGGTTDNVAEYFSAISAPANNSAPPPSGPPVDEEMMASPYQPNEGAPGGGGGGPPEVDEDLTAAPYQPNSSGPAGRGGPGGYGGYAQAFHSSTVNTTHAVNSGGSAAAGSAGYGTMHRGIQTDVEVVDGAGAGAGAGSSWAGASGYAGGSSSYVESTTIKNVYSSQQQVGAAYGGGSAAGYGASGSSAAIGVGTSDGAYSSGVNTGEMTSGYNLGSGQPMSGDAFMTSSSFAYDQRSASAMQASGYLASSPTASDATLSPGANAYQMRNLPLSAMAGGGGATLVAPNLMTTAEQIRVDCVQLTTNGRFVITGSIYGPPQVWDLKVSNSTVLFSLSFYEFTDSCLIACFKCFISQYCDTSAAIVNERLLVQFPLDVLLLVDHFV